MRHNLLGFHSPFPSIHTGLSVDQINAIIEAGGEENMQFILSHLIQSAQTAPTVSGLLHLVSHTKDEINRQVQALHQFFQAAHSLLPPKYNNVHMCRALVMELGLDAMLCVRIAAEKMINNLTGRFGGMLDIRLFNGDHFILCMLIYHLSILLL